MNHSSNNGIQARTKGNGRQHLLTGAVAVMLVAAAIVAARYLWQRKSEDPGPLHQVTRGPLTIAVTTAGTLQSKRTATVRCEVEGRNTVIWVVDEGTHVTNNQPLVEIDASAFTDRLTDQQVTVGNADSALTASSEKLAIAKIEQRSSVAAAELKLELALLEQEKYLKGEYPQTLQEQESRIALAYEEVERAFENLRWTRRLADEGYLTLSELQADEMSLKQKRSNLQAAVTSLNVLTNYTVRKQVATLDSNVVQAEMDLERVTRQMRANVVQAESDFRTKEMQLERQRSRLTHLEEQVANCSIRAPTNGVVIYNSTMQASRRRWGGDPLQAGATVVMRQELIHIPVEGGMIAELSVPESSLTKLERGQVARIKVEAMPGKEYRARLTKIGLLPDGRSAWLNPDLQLYNCVVELDTHEGLRAGMNCEIEMEVERHDNVLYVPVQSVLRVGNESTVYVVDKNGKLEPRTVETGLDNGRMMHIKSGLEVGEIISLAPPLIEGAVYNGDDEKSAEELPELSGKPQESDAAGESVPGESAASDDAAGSDATENGTNGNGGQATTSDAGEREVKRTPERRGERSNNGARRRRPADGQRNNGNGSRPGPMNEVRGR